jgi:hypothetical protein
MVAARSGRIVSRRARLGGQLANCEQRRSRRLLLDRLVRPPVDLAPLILERLTDERSFVQRNLLILLTRSGCAPATFSAEPWTTHPHPQVRYEAIRLQLTLPAEWPCAAHGPRR